MTNYAPASIRLAILVVPIALVFAFVLERTSAQNPPAAPPPQAPAEKPVEEVQKNIQALKGLPQSQLAPVMNYISASLGVKCVFCHVNKAGTWDFASDEKGEKKTARAMIEMVTGINKNTFRGSADVGCYTCHRGRTSVARTVPLPVPTPEPPRQGPAAPAQPQREAMPSADQILDKYHQAVGGPAVIEKLKSRVMKGTLTTADGTDLGYELSQSGPEMVLAVITTQRGAVERGFNGTAGWEKSPGGLRELGSGELYYLRRYPDIYKDLKLKDQFTRINVAGKPKIDGRDVYLLRATTAGGKREQLFFDAETGLLVRRSTSTTTPIGMIPEQVDFEDYRDVDGLKLPFTVRVSAVDPNYSVTRKFTEIKLNVPLDAKRFNKPA